jgi:hypothetical protein
MIFLNPSKPQHQLKRWVKAQKPVHWASYAVFGAMVSVRAVTGGLFILPLYFIAAYALVIVNQYRHKTPKQVRLVALVAIATAFAWGSMTSFAPAHALFFNKLFDLLTTAITAFGVPGLDAVPNWITQGFKILAFIAVAIIIVKLLKTRQGDEEETGKGFAQVIKFVIILALGDVLLSLIGV